MNENRKIEPEKIKIIDIKTISGSISAPSDVHSESIGSHKFSFESAMGINSDENIVGIQFTVNIEALSKKNTPLPVNARYTHEIVFKVENLDDFLSVSEENNESKVERFMGGTLMGIAFSTIRGIIYSRTQGTSLTAVVLPVVDPKKFLSDDDIVDG